MAGDKILCGDPGIMVSPQGIHEASDTQKLRLGTRMQRGDRVFRYAKAGGTLKTDYIAHHWDMGISSYDTVPTATPAGSRTLWATIAATDGVAIDGVVAKDELEGGWVVVMKLKAGASYTTYTFQILNNTAVAAGGGDTKLTIDSPLPYAATVSAATEITGNIYSNVQTLAGSGTEALAAGRIGVGQPMIDATVGQFCWLQTWGPTFVNPYGTAGNAATKNQLVIRQDGSVGDHDDSVASSEFAQHVGCIITRVAGGAETQGTPLIMLQIAP